MSDAVQPQRWQPTRLPSPWDSPGKKTGMGWNFLLQCMKGKVKVKLLSCVWLLTIPWTAAHQAPLSMGFSRHEYWSGVPLSSPYLASQIQIVTCRIMCKCVYIHGLVYTYLFPWAIRINSTSVETRVPSIQILFSKCCSPWKESGLLGEMAYVSIEAGNIDNVREASCNAREWVSAEHGQILNLKDITVSELSQRKTIVAWSHKWNPKTWTHRNWEKNCGFQRLGSM